MTINQRVKLIRKTLGLSQTEFAEILGYANSNISHIESSAGKVPDYLVKYICLAFGVRETYLLTGEGDMFVSRYAPQIHDRVLKLPEKYQAHVLMIVDDLLSRQ
ncbi:helix-turn-helix domain-containing protein [Christensenellaceae bacterium OttesenSCG-928-M15]|nr:helix-turn-helix domain-containing protein [Christensenellaceae bacterium OttesenSCG-928-M15]